MAKKRLVVLSGAGMSAESGITTFRETGGLWEQYRIEDVATPEAFQENPALVLEFYNQRRKQLEEVEPNVGHKTLARLQEKFDVQIITQNVDNLHESAGSKHILHLHGELTKVRSTKHPHLIYDIGTKAIKLGDKCDKGAQLRPHIVWFGESVPAIDDAVPLVNSADIFLVIGTSLNVYPAAGLIMYAKHEIPKFLIDPNNVEVPYGLNFNIIQKGAGEGSLELEKKIMQYV
ncbi:MAG: NAD-dependent deacylase [Salinivirgaceae bacterium]|jgi:NAD-dependent deacetylase|nr:NAD-dependent deacylase [Salinivirgaceae bacterium]